MNSEELRQFRKNFYENLEKDMKNKSLDEIVETSMHQTEIKNENTNKIMVCIGSYKKEKEGLEFKQYLTYKDEFNIDYRQYCDLESGETYLIKRDDIKEFESKYKTIYLQINIYNVQEYYKKYNELKRKFFKSLLYAEQDEAILKLTNKK